MKNKIHVLLFLLFFGITGNSAFAQKNSWTTGFNIGAIGAVYQKGHVTDTYRNIMSEAPLFLELTTSYGITNYLSISTGIAWAFKYVRYKRVEMGERMLLNYFTSKELEPVNDLEFFCEYHSIEVPIKLNFSIPLGKSRFYFMGNIGLIFDFIILEGAEEVDPWVQDDTWWHNSRLTIVGDGYALSTFQNLCRDPKKVNFLINAGIGFGYRFKTGVGLCLTGDYNAGTRMLADVAIKNQLYNNPHYSDEAPLKEYVDKLYFKGDYWKVSLGISYTFKNKEKKHAE